MAKQTIRHRAKLKKVKPLAEQTAHYEWSDGYAAGFAAAQSKASKPSLWSRIKGWFK